MKSEESDLFARVAATIRESKRLRKQTRDHVEALKPTEIHRPEAGDPTPTPPTTPKPLAN